MTLTEILVGSIMFAIFAIAISTILSPMVLSFMRANDFAEYNAILDSVGNQISSDLVKASAAPTDATALQVPIGLIPVNNAFRIPIQTSDDIEYTVHAVNGTLLRNGNEVFSEGFYKGKEVDFTVALHPLVPNSYIIVVTIRVPEGATNRFGLSGADLEREFVVRPVLLINDTP